jgi:hypothetical protein
VAFFREKFSGIEMSRVIVHIHNGVRDRRSFAGYKMGDALDVEDVLTSKGSEILSAMQSQYGKKKGESVFYASIKAGKITGAEDEGDPGKSEEMGDPVSEQASSGEIQPDIGASEVISDGAWVKDAAHKCKCGAHKK